MSGFNRLIKNSIANIINGFSNVILGIVISPFLINILTINDFSIWSLVLQIGAFFSLLGFSGQLSVARYVTLAKTERNQLNIRNVIRYGNIVAVCSIIFSLLILYIIFDNFFEIFSAIKEQGENNTPTVFLIISLSFILGLIASVYNGYFTGIERNEIPALVNLVSRVVLGVGVFISAHYSMIYMAITYFIINVFSYLIIFVVYKTISCRNEIKNSDKCADINISEFVSYCFGVLIFNLSTFLIINLNGVIIGKYAFKDYAYYALSITLVTAIIGFINAGLTPLLQPIVKLVHKDKKMMLDDFIYLLSKAILFISFIILMANFVLGQFILRLWIGSDVAALTYPVFVFLLLTNISRLVGSPLGLTYLAKGKQNEIIYLPLLEGIISVVMTYLLVNKLGIYASAVSMAISTIIIMLIYSFKLINIAAMDESRNKYKLLLAGGPALLLVSIYFLAQIRIMLNNEITIIGFNIVVIGLIAVITLIVLKDVKHIKMILES